MPRWLRPALGILVVLTFIPLVLVARARLLDSPRPRISVVPDMDSQPKLKPQAASPLFADGRGARPQVAGTVARGGLAEDCALHEGRGPDGQWIERYPLAVTPELLARGRERFTIYCAPCHGFSGKGDGMVARRADKLQQPAWTPPTSLHADAVRARPLGHLYNTIAEGIRSMPAYGPQLAPEERWAVVAYLRALQRSQNATAEDLSPEERAALR